MNSPLDLLPRPRPVSVDEELDLAALLELFVPGDEGPGPTRRSLGSSRARLIGWAQDSSRRAARWGAVAGVSE